LLWRPEPYGILHDATIPVPRTSIATEVVGFLCIRGRAGLTSTQRQAQMRPQRPKILLSEGSSLSSREAITALGLAGHRVELVSSDRMCLGRFSRFVSHVHHAPASGDDQDGYLASVIETVKVRGIDVLMPVHEQAYLFSAARKKLPAALAVAVADFPAFEQVQSKATFSGLLTRLEVPQPVTEIVQSANEFCTERPYPFFVKAAFGTASTGVWRVGDAYKRDAVLHQLQQHDAFTDGLLVQAAVAGPLERTQAVFDHGRLVACHIYRQVIEGPSGGDVLKISINRAEVRGFVERIGEALTWHGALSFDYIQDDAIGSPRFFDANPRLVEPMNAWLSGVDLPGALLQVSLGENPPVQAEGREGVLTRLGLMGLLDAARQNGRRSDIIREIGLLVGNSGRYRGTIEELVPLRTDPWCAIPLAVVVAKLMRAPDAAARFAQTTVAAYSLSAAAIRRMHAWQAGDAASGSSSATSPTE
jgi:predicted ATP-grasp superfamily ATP-dependent carboligase